VFLQVSVKYNHAFVFCFLFLSQQQGFRDGIQSGQEVKLQEGFNAGYRTASRVVFDVAKLRGEIR